MSCTICYELTPAGFSAGVYSLEVINGTPRWFHPADPSDGISRVVVLPALITALVADVSDTKIVQCQASTSGGGGGTVTNEIRDPYGITYVGQTTPITPPTGAVSVTLMIEANDVEVSFDSGLTFPLKLSAKEVKTWDNVDTSLMRIKPVSASANFDIHGEK